MPYTDRHEYGTRNDVGMVLSKGLVRGVYLVAIPASAAALTEVQVGVTHQGAYPVGCLADADAGPWRVAVTPFFTCAPPAGGGACVGDLAVAADFPGGSPPPVRVALAAGDGPAGTFILTVPVGGVRLWQPNGMGAQALYTLNVTFTPAGGGPAVADSRTVGFRVFSFVTADDSDPAALEGVDGSGK